MYSLEALILAGGQGRRMLGSDKGRIPYRGLPLVIYPLQAMKRLGLKVTVSCNRSRFYYRALADRVVHDRGNGFSGPLHALNDALDLVGSDHCLVTPCDTPNFSTVHIQRLLDEARYYPDHWIVVRSTDGIHPLHGVFPMSLYGRLRELVEAGEERMMAALNALPHREVFLPQRALINVNHMRSLKR